MCYVVCWISTKHDVAMVIHQYESSSVCVRVPDVFMWVWVLKIYGIIQYKIQLQYNVYVCVFTSVSCLW